MRCSASYKYKTLHFCQQHGTYASAIQHAQCTTDPSLCVKGDQLPQGFLAAQHTSMHACNSKGPTLQYVCVLGIYMLPVRSFPYFAQGHTAQHLINYSTTVIHWAQLQVQYPPFPSSSSLLSIHELGYL